MNAGTAVDSAEINSSPGEDDDALTDNASLVHSSALQGYGRRTAEARKIDHSDHERLGDVGRGGHARQQKDGRTGAIVTDMTADRSLIARLAAHESWARTADPSARTAAARRAMLERFEHQVDPDGVLPPAERARRAGHARQAYFARLALRSAQARRKTTGADEVDGEADKPDGRRPHTVDPSRDGFSSEKATFDAETAREDEPR